ncbi:mechanosensitive ion channel family protein [Labrys wisconsinensis]|uniref:Small-conductance mechanosensitive channel n=1 Tax=Labrys wisconsinensis TaxID=425677 RepID=A0ABU0JPS0_9HYPH|nr:mechanosensitive ion channel family protein [Labrys wisconsinensis]MDQ0475378.1 small-conductance mechanosensitive channel/CRP-like cAMP-binding protein [Labrys wisconsinensis]
MTSQIAAGLLICLCATAWRMMRSLPAWLRLATGAVLLAGLTAAVVQMVGSPLQPVFVATGAAAVVWEQVVVAAWWLLAARLLVEVLRSTLFNRGLAAKGRLQGDLLAGLIYLAAVLTVVDTVLDLPIRALLATSGVIAIVLGLALQSTLADVFSGIAVGIERPFNIGDRVWLEGPIEGVVDQVNWRSVRIRTDGGDIATVPHSVAAKSRVINRSVPTPQRSDSVRIPCAASVPPERVAELVRHALLLSPRILAQPQPAVALVRIGRRSNEYEIGFAVASSNDLWHAKSTLLEQVLRQFRSAGVETADRPGGGATSEPDPASGSRRFLAIPLFHDIADDQRERLCRQALSRSLEPGDALFRQGDTEGSLFFVASGVMEVTRTVGARSSSLGRIGAGDYIGEIGLLTGAPHAATITALTPSDVLELRKEHLAPLLAETPHLMHAFEASARRGQALFDRRVAASVGAETVPPGQLLARIRDYFRVHHVRPGPDAHAARRHPAAQANSPPGGD